VHGGAGFRFCFHRRAVRILKFRQANKHAGALPPYPLKRSPPVKVTATKYLDMQELSLLMRRCRVAVSKQRDAMSREPQTSAHERAARALVSMSVALCALAGEAAAKKPGDTYCFNGICHRVMTIAETGADVGRVKLVRASFYDDCKVDPGNPCTKLSSGEAFRPDRADNAASPVYPNGTVLVLWNPTNNRAARVRINNAGPYVKGRLLDVSRATAQRLGFIDAGVTELQIRVVAAPPTDDNTRTAEARDAGLKMTGDLEQHGP